MVNIETKSGVISPVVVFDIDGTLCYYENRIENFNKQIETNPECTCLYNSGGLYIFKPYIKFLMNYLIHMGCRIVFFSAGSKERNEMLVSKLLNSFYSENRKNKLTASGQFKIFSLPDCFILRHRCPNNTLPMIFHKNLSVVLQEDETIDDVILIDDRFDIVALGQEVMIHMGLFDSTRQTNSCFFPIQTHFFKNGIYFLVGLFKTYFDNSFYRNLPIRAAFKHMFLTTGIDSTIVKSNERISGHMVSTGLQYVRLYTPEAVFYGSEHSNMKIFSSDQLISLNHSSEQIQSLRAQAAIVEPTTRLDITKWAAMYIFNLNYFEKLQITDVYI